MTEQRVDRGIPGLVAGGVRELVGSDDIAAGEDARHGRLQIVIDLDGTPRRGIYTQGVQAQVFRIGCAPDSHEHAVEAQGHVCAIEVAARRVPLIIAGKGARFAAGVDGDAPGEQTALHQC